MLITIARKCGCRGDEIGNALAEKYGIPFYNKEKSLQLARENGLTEKYPDFYGEIPMNTLLYTISEEERISAQTPKKALSNLLGEKDCIVLGRCGNYAFRDREDVLSIFLTGDDEAREEQIAKKHDISKKKAHELVMRTDERRRAYHRYYTGEEWGLADYYDLCLNVTEMGVEGTLRIIDAYWKEKHK